MRVLVTSEKDIASQTIKKALLEDYEFKETSAMFDGNHIFKHEIDDILLITSKKDLIYTDHIEPEIHAEVLIYCSRHRAESGKPALLVHSTGNLMDEALYGGTPRRLSISCASLVSTALRQLYKERNDRGLSEFDVTMEATHHGPTSVNTPLLFVELGSDETQWGNLEGGRCVAAAVMACATAPIQETSYIGFGGTHYVSKFNRLVLEKNIRIGHMAPKYALDEITHDIIKMMIQRSKEEITAAVIDWKGTNSQQRDKLIPILEDLHLELVRARKI